MHMGSQGAGAYLTQCTGADWIPTKRACKPELSYDIQEMASGKLPTLLLAAALLALLYAGFRPSDGSCVSDECNYLADGLLFMRTGVISTGGHLDEAILKLGLTHASGHATGFLTFLGTLFKAFGSGIETLWRWNAIFFASCALLFARFAVRDGKGSVPGAFAWVAALALTFPNAWSFVNWSMQDLTLLGLAALALLAWEHAIRSESPYAILPFALAYGPMVWLRESEAIPLLIGLGLWVLIRHRPALRGKKRSFAPALKAATVSAAAFTAVGLVFVKMNERRPPPWAQGIQGAILDGSIFRRVFVEQEWTILQVITHVFVHFVNQGEIYFAIEGRAGPHAPLRYWMVALMAFGAYRLWRVGWTAAPSLAFGVAASITTLLASFTLHLGTNHATTRVIHASVLILWLGLVVSYLPKSGPQRKGSVRGRSLWMPAAFLLAIGAAQVALSAYEYSLWGAHAPYRKIDQNGGAIEAMVSAGADKREGTPLLYYDFIGKHTIASDNFMAIRYQLNQRMAELGGPYYHALYAGFLMPQLDREQILTDLRNRGICPTFAVVPWELPQGLEALNRICGQYSLIHRLTGKHSTGWTTHDSTWEWGGGLYARQ